MLPQLEGALSKSVIDFATTFSLFVPQIKMLYADVIRNYKTKYEASEMIIISEYNKVYDWRKILFDIQHRFFHSALLFQHLVAF